MLQYAAHRDGTRKPAKAENVMAPIRQLIRKFTPFQLITVSFFLVIVLGSLLLSLPAAHTGRESVSYLDALFTAGSAVCVTGLIVHNTATVWSVFGKAVILVLIQIGGLGVITVVIGFTIFSGKRIGLRGRSVMQNSLNAPQLGGIIRFTRFLLLFTLSCEAAGAILLYPVFYRQYGPAGAFGRAVFHAVSAFCNAGFDILGDPVPYASLTAYRGGILLNLTIMALIVTGGLGFLTWSDLIRNRFRWKRLRMQTKVILVVSLLLVLVPACIFFFLEFSGSSLKERILMSLFQSVTTRTAGFNTADLSAVSEPSKLLMIVLMLIGGSPGSAAGGMKTTTFAVAVLTAVSFMRQKRDVNVYGRSVSRHVVREACTLLLLYLFMLITGTFLISAIEKLPAMDCMFEAASALGTVGLTVGITPGLHAASKLLLIVFMYFGRVGGLTLAFSAAAKGAPDPGRLPEEQIMVG